MTPSTNIPDIPFECAWAALRFDTAMPVGDARSSSGLTGVEVVDTDGDLDAIYPLMSVTKLFSAWASLVAVDRHLLALDDEIGHAGASTRAVTIRHLLAHASGMAFDRREFVAQPATKRIYSNAGIETLADHVADAVAMGLNSWVETSVLEPLGLASILIDGSPAYSGEGNLTDLVRFAGELARPTLISRELADEARSPVFPGIRGVTPGYGSVSDNRWGLGMEIKGSKTRTYFPPSASPASFGHFGQSGSLLWIDPEAGCGLVFLGAQPFSDWHRDHWAAMGETLLFSDAR